MAIMKDIEKPITSVAELNSETDGFTGTDAYHKFGVRGVYLTDGAAYVANRVGAFWLFMGVSLLIRGKYHNIPFQVWYLDVKEDKTATLCMREDTGRPFIHRHTLEYTDFPVGRFEFWAVRGYVTDDDDFVVMLKTEY
jgi:hypothetical protein